MDENTIIDNYLKDLKSELEKRDSGIMAILGNSSGGTIKIFKYLSLGTKKRDDDRVIMGIAVHENEHGQEVVGDVVGDDTGQVYFSLTVSPEQRLADSLIKLTAKLVAKKDEVIRAIETSEELIDYGK